MLDLIRKKSFLIISVAILGLLLTSNLPAAIVGAQTATSEAGAVEVTEDDQVDQIRKEVEDLIKEEVSGQKKGFFGQIADLFNQTIILQTSQGKKTAEADKETAVVDEERETIEFEDLEIGSYVIVMGYAENSEKLLTKRIVVIPQPAEEERIAILGTVEEVEEGDFIVKSLSQEKTWTVTTASKTEAYQKIEDEVEEIEIETIHEADLLVIVGASEKENELTAKLIRLLTAKTPSPMPEEAEEATEAGE